MVRRSFIACLLALALLGTAHASHVTFFYFWQYPKGVSIDPSLVTITIEPGTIVATDIGERSGLVVFTTPWDRSCYQVTIHASTRTYRSVNREECFQHYLPQVHAP